MCVCVCARAGGGTSAADGEIGVPPGPSDGRLPLQRQSTLVSEGETAVQEGLEGPPQTVPPAQERREFECVCVCVCMGA